MGRTVIFAANHIQKGANGADYEARQSMSRTISDANLQVCVRWSDPGGTRSIPRASTPYLSKNATRAHSEANLDRGTLSFISSNAWASLTLRPPHHSANPGGRNYAYVLLTALEVTQLSPHPPLLPSLTRHYTICDRCRPWYIGEKAQGLSERDDERFLFAHGAGFYLSVWRWESRTDSEKKKPSNDVNSILWHILIVTY